MPAAGADFGDIIQAIKYVLGLSTTPASAQYGVKSVQRGTVTFDPNGATSGTATITSVTTTKSQLRYLGHTFNDGRSDGTHDSGNHVKIVLTNATTVTASVGFTSGWPGSISCLVSFEVIEYN